MDSYQIWNKIKQSFKGQVLWLKPVILTIWEVEIGNIATPGQLYRGA
jgi:hypothetical protein